MEENDENLDFIDLLLSRDLTGLCYEIFNHLDSYSFTNCRLVCHYWKNFIDYHFFELPKGRNFFHRNLTENILNKNYEPITHKVNTEEKREKLFAIVADSESVCVTTLTGRVSNYKFHSLDLLWTLKLCEQEIQHCMNKTKVFVVTSTPDAIGDGHIFIIDRPSGRLIHSLFNFHSHGIFGVQVYENSILATADSWGTIKFHQIGDEIEPKLMHEEERYRGRGGHGFTHLDSSDSFLVSGSGRGELIAWNFKSGERLHTLQSKQAICALRVRWPLVVTCTTEFELSDERCKGVKLFDMEKEILIRHIECGYASDVHLKGNILMVCGNFNSYKHHDLLETSHKFWNLSELLNKSLKIEDVGHRSICTYPTKSLDTILICAIVGSNILTTEGDSLVQRSFWP